MVLVLCELHVPKAHATMADLMKSLRRNELPMDFHEAITNRIDIEKEKK